MGVSAPASEATIRGYGWEDHANVTAVPVGADLNWFDAAEVNEYQAAMLGILGGAQSFASVTASTTQTQAGGQALTRALNDVATVANADDAVVLPTVIAGNVVVVTNNGANRLQIFPFSGDAIDGLAANAAITCAVGTTAIFRAKSASAWDSSGIDEFFDTVVIDQGLIVNEGGGDNDTRIEGDTDANLLYVDAGNDRVGIGDSTPGEKLSVAGNILATGNVQGVTQAEFDTLTDDSMADTLHRHSELSASDGSPDPALIVDISGDVAIGTSTPPSERLLVYKDANALTELNIMNPAETTLAGAILRVTTGTTDEIDGFLGAFDESYVTSWQANRIVIATDTTAAGLSFGTRRSSGDIRFLTGGSTPTERVRIESGGDVGVGVTNALAQLHVDQSSLTGAQPVLRLDQADVSEEFVRFIGTAAAGTLTQSIVNEADVDVMTLEGFLKVNVQDDGNQVTDQAYFMPIYSIAVDDTSTSTSGSSSTSTSTSTSNTFSSTSTSSSSGP